MRIGIDVTCWVNERGYGRFTRELVPALARHATDSELVCFADPWAAEAFDVSAANVRVQRVELSAAPARAAAADGSRSIFDLLALTRAVARDRPEVFLFPSVYTYFPVPPGLPTAVVIHDAIAERFPELTLPSRRAKWFWKAKVRLALWQARTVLTVSDHAARELSEVLSIPPDRLHVTLEAPSRVYRPSDSPDEIAAAAAAIGLPPDARWLVYVGGFNPHKNVDLLAAAHGEVARQLGSAAPHLLLVGNVEGDVFHQGLESIHRAIRGAGSGDLVHWTGFLPDETLRHLHSGSLALVLPSANEGFGLPAVEAAACGAPVIATTASPLPEILAGGGIFVRPGDRAALTDAVRRLATDGDTRRRLGRRAREQAAALTWDHAAEVVLGALTEATQPSSIKSRSTPQ